MDNDKEWEKIMEHTKIASQMLDIENKLAALVKKYGLENKESIPLAGLTLIMAAVTRLMALTITHEVATSVFLMKDLVHAAHDIQEDTTTALKYALDHMTGGEELTKTSLGDILGQSLWSADGEK